MSRVRRIFAAALFAFILSSFPAWALEPQDALIARPKESFYVTLRMNDLSGILRNLLSPANIELIASLAGPSDAQGIRLIGSYASRIPAKSIALVAGLTADEKPFVQIAASMPEELRPKLALVAEGKATTADLAVLILGDDSPLFSILPDVAVRQGKRGPYYTQEGSPFALSAEGNLLLIAFSPEELAASKEALEKADKRLAFGRRFKSPNYCAFHLDMPTAYKITKESGETDKSADALLKAFKTPLNFEIAFDSKPGSFLMSCAVNVLESLAMANRFETLKPIKGGGFFSAGEGKPYFGFGALLDFSPEDMEAFSPKAFTQWNSLLEKLAKEGIAADDVKNLLKGSVSFTAGGSGRLFGQPTPGGSVAFTGQKGAAGSIVKKLLENEKFTSSVPLAPLKSKGWDMLFQVDPSILPASVVLGVKGETLFLGVLDPKTIDKEPSFSPQVAKFLAEDSYSTLFFDFPVLWEHLRRELLNEKSFFSEGLRTRPFAKNVKEILEGDIPVGLLKAWMPTVETSFLEIQTVAVPPEKNILPRLVDLLKASLAGGGANGIPNESDGDYDDDISSGLDRSQPLILLMVAKGAIEEALEEDPDSNLDELREDLSDFAVILETESGEIYVGTQVAGEEKATLREQAGQFGLLGSAGLTLAPEGTPYNGQEAAWLKID
ncbi:MAG: hypothetical protein LBR71_07710 [Synergistaceae bacterium]|nr:hypothetical protein [Synergistaceae bacterium]